MKRSPWLMLYLILGFVFLYAPIVVLVLYSFNKSQLVTYWGGFSLRWYHQLFHDWTVIDAALLSIKIATLASSIAVVLGTMLAVILRKYRRFRGKTFLYSLTVAPIIMPDVVSGLSLLLLFVSLESLIGWPSTQGFNTILMAHITFCTAYASIVIQSRLVGLDPALEEAAQDLGASPTRTFFSITLPQLLPGLIAAWLLSFTLSIDDVVITTFVAGPSSTTLPMYIFSTVKTVATPELNAVASILISIVVFGLVIAGLIRRR